MCSTTLVGRLSNGDNLFVDQSGFHTSVQKGTVPTGGIQQKLLLHRLQECEASNLTLKVVDVPKFTRLCLMLSMLDLSRYKPYLVLNGEELRKQFEACIKQGGHAQLSDNDITILRQRINEFCSQPNKLKRKEAVDTV